MYMIEAEAITGLGTGIVKISGEEMSRGELRDICADSVYGKRLVDRGRFEKDFMPIDVSVSVWTESIGRHGNNLYHMWEAAIEGRKFVEGLRGTDLEFNPEEEKLFETAIQIHDMGEAEVKDIPDPEKTDKLHREEMAAFSGIMNDVFYDTVYYAQRYELIHKIKEILSDESSKLGRSFRAVELMGYTNAAFSAWNSLSDTESDLQTSLRVLAHKVTADHLPKLVEFADIYIPVEEFLLNHKEDIDSILEDSKLFETLKKKKYEQAKTSWDEFNSSMTV